MRPLATGHVKVGTHLWWGCSDPYCVVASHIVLFLSLNWLFSAGRRQITIKASRTNWASNWRTSLRTRPIVRGAGSIKGTPICLPASYWWRPVSGDRRRAASGVHGDLLTTDYRRSLQPLSKDCSGPLSEANFSFLVAIYNKKGAEDFTNRLLLELFQKNQLIKISRLRKQLFSFLLSIKENTITSSVIIKTNRLTAVK